MAVSIIERQFQRNRFCEALNVLDGSCGFSSIRFQYDTVLYKVHVFTCQSGNPGFFSVRVPRTVDSIETIDDGRWTEVARVGRN